MRERWRLTKDLSNVFEPLENPFDFGSHGGNQKQNVRIHKRMTPRGKERWFFSLSKQWQTQEKGKKVMPIKLAIASHWSYYFLQEEDWYLHSSKGKYIR